MTIAQNLLKDWNAKKGSNWSVGSEANPSYRSIGLQEAIDRDGDLFIDWFMSKYNDDGFTGDPYPLTRQGAEYMQFKSSRQKEKGDANLSTLRILSGELVKLIGTELSNQIEGEIKNRLDSYVQDKVMMKIITIDNLPIRKVEGVAHEKLETIIKFIAMDEPVMLVGPAGSGKNVICKQAADALGLQFYFSNAVTQEYQITGFVDAMGNYQGTQFYEAFTKGGLFLLDEIDASIPEVLVKLNAAIANGYFDFPKFGRVQAHKDFRVVAAANTYGTGASIEYVGRNQLDAASINRFAVVEVGYDPRVEEAVSNGNPQALDFCRKFRKGLERNGVRAIVSYREISRLSKMIAAGLDITEAIKTCVTKGLEKDTLRMVANSMDSTEFKGNLLKICQ